MTSTPRMMDRAFGNTDHSWENCTLQQFVHLRCTGRLASHQRCCIPLSTSHWNHQSRLQWPVTGLYCHTRDHKRPDPPRRQELRGARKQTRECWRTSCQLGRWYCILCNFEGFYTLEKWSGPTRQHWGQKKVLSVQRVSSLSTTIRRKAFRSDRKRVTVAGQHPIPSKIRHHHLFEWQVAHAAYY
jgi:hypothetical protein